MRPPALPYPRPALPSPTLPAPYLTKASLTSRRRFPDEEKDFLTLAYLLRWGINPVVIAKGFAVRLPMCTRVFGINRRTATVATSKQVTPAAGTHAQVYAFSLFITRVVCYFGYIRVQNRY